MEKYLWNVYKMCGRDILIQQAVDLGEGNPGALTVLGMVMQDCSPSLVVQVFKNLHDRRIRGCQIWVIYKDRCDEDIGKFVFHMMNSF